MSPPGRGWEAKVVEAADRVMALELFKGRERVRGGGHRPSSRPLITGRGTAELQRTLLAAVSSADDSGREEAVDERKVDETE